MPPIQKRLKEVLDETRLAMLGTQLLLGLQYNAAFAQHFDRLPWEFKWLDAIALMLILITAALLLATPSFHQIAQGGHATGSMLARASLHLKCALLPLSLALGIDIALGLVTSVGIAGATAAAAAFIATALFLWFGLPMVAAARRRRGEDSMEDKKQSLEARIVQALTEIRVILPGAQALFGFQFAAVLTESFQHLSPVSRGVHLASLGLVAVTIVMLIAPAAYHRIAAGGNAEEGVLRYAIRMMLPAEGLLALGIVGDGYVTVQKITENPSLALGTSIAAAFGFAVLLYGVPIASRRRRRSPASAVGLTSG
jgi:Family of unknown function (DUF6328)